MKKTITFLTFTLAAITACNNHDGYKNAEDAQDAARQFIQASLDGNYDKARFYLYKDNAGANEMLLQKWRADYNNWSQEDKVGHKNANIIVITTQNNSDSSLNYVFSNSYKNDTTTIKIVKANNSWLVDLKDIH